jgi:hypothetical protein
LGGVNPYGYVHNPLGWIDPQGLCKEVGTPYGAANQSDSPTALAARTKVKNGSTLYRMGTTGRSETSGAQFWALEHPSTPGYAGRYGIPQENIDNSNFIMTAKLKPGGDFVTRPVPEIGNNPGGGIEVVVPSDGVNIITFSKY